jgi:putative FmdB family regulatory protein
VPIYEYQCQKCHHREELIQKHTDAPLTECPKCHGAMTKLIAAPALQFKGSGFYITDYSDKGKDKSDKGKNKSDSESTEKKPSADKPAAESTPSTGSTSTEKKSDSGGSSPPPAKSSGDGAT